MVAQAPAPSPLPPPPKSPKSSVPPDPQAQRMKSIANIIATTAALVGAFGALLRPPDHSVTKASYDELSASMKTLSEENAKLHDDQVALRGYLDGYVKAQSAKEKEIAAAVVAEPHAATPAASAAVERAKPIANAPPPPAPPDVGPRPPIVRPPSFDQVQQKAAK